MANISLLKRLKTIFDLVFSQSFFVTLFIILVLTVVVLLINIRVKSKAPRYAAAIVYAGLAVLVLARYGKYVLSLNDSIVDKFFRAMYFPNLVVYLSMLIITLLLLAIIIIDTKFLIVTKISNSMCFFVIWFLFVLVVDTVKKEGLNFYEVKDIYANQTLMVLLQASMCVFAVWLGIIVVDLIVRKLSYKMDMKDSNSFDAIDNSVNLNNINDYLPNGFDESYNNDSVDDVEKL